MNLSQAIESLRPCVVQVAFSARARATNILGTGFFVNSDGFVITAHHVIHFGQRLVEQIDADRKRLTIGLAQPNTERMRGNFTEVDFDVIDEDERHDLSLLKLKRNPFKGEVRSGIKIGDREIPLLFGTPTLNPLRPLDGVSVGISGYPFESPFLVTNAGWIGTSWAVNIQMIARPGAPPWFRDLDIADIYLADVEINPGNSGGPVFVIENASVIGLCVASRRSPVWDQHGNDAIIDDTKLFYSSGLTIVVPTRYLLDLFKRNSVEWLEV